jgi:hypothetical protein
VTAKRRLVPDAEVRKVLETLRDYGIEPGAVDVRADGVTVWPKGQQRIPGNDFDRWQAEDEDRERAAHRR